MKKNKKNQFIVCNNFIEILLYDKNNNLKGKTIVDKEDFDRVKNFQWYLGNYGDRQYVRTLINNKKQTLHRILLNNPKNKEIDHINHDELDNRKCNLRIVNRSQNNMNRKKDIKGLTWLKKNKTWMVRIVYNKKEIHLGCFKNKQDAINRRIEAEKIYFGEYRYKWENAYV